MLTIIDILIEICAMANWLECLKKTQAIPVYHYIHFMFILKQVIGLTETSKG